MLFGISWRHTSFCALAFCSLGVFKQQQWHCWQFCGGSRSSLHHGDTAVLLQQPSKLFLGQAVPSLVECPCSYLALATTLNSIFTSANIIIWWWWWWWWQFFCCVHLSRAVPSQFTPKCEVHIACTTHDSFRTCVITIIELWISVKRKLFRLQVVTVCWVFVQSRLLRKQVITVCWVFVKSKLPRLHVVRQWHFAESLSKAGCTDCM